MLGDIGGTFVSILVALACFTTAVAIVVSLADFFKALYADNNTVYVYVTILCCIVGVIMGSYDVGFIIDAAIPALLLIYPVSITLIFLNVLPDRFATALAFRTVVIVTLIFSLPDVIGFISPSNTLNHVTSYIPFAQYQLGWVLPSIIAFILVNIFRREMQ
jgi:LIVCS family branched-chain amino acid:cation transporter